MAEETQQQQPAAYFVAVHIGAGYHSQSKTGAYRALCNEVCQSVSKLLQQGATARNAVAEAIALLEVSK
jgi:taspase (threonine aspartase 1)